MEVAKIYTQKDINSLRKENNIELNSLLKLFDIYDVCKHLRIACKKFKILLKRHANAK